MDDYLDALEKEIDYTAQKFYHKKLNSIYIGGGTPTTLSPAQLDRLIRKIKCSFDLKDCLEFTVEAGRPDSITREKLLALKKNGISRISVNPQTMKQQTLDIIGRHHTVDDTIQSFKLARELGFDNINMDVIAGLPGEHAADMEHTLDEIIKLSPENLTVHTLALKRSSRLVTEGEKYPMPEAEEVEHMVHMGSEAAARLGMRPYYMYRQKYMSGNLENVGYAKPGTECVYNIDMMEDTTAIMSHGAGAMTKCVYDAARRVERVPAPKEISTYIAKVEKLSGEKARLFL